MSLRIAGVKTQKNWLQTKPLCSSHRPPPLTHIPAQPWPLQLGCEHCLPGRPCVQVNNSGTCEPASTSFSSTPGNTGCFPSFCSRDKASSTVPGSFLLFPRWRFSPHLSDVLISPALPIPQGAGAGGSTGSNFAPLARAPFINYFFIPFT